MTIRSYRDLEVWQKAVALAVETYQLARKFPKTEQYGLSSQLQRASVSVAANIAEGHGRHGLGEYLHHLSIANGSLMETETHLVVAHRLAYVSSTQVDRVLSLSAEVGRMLSGLTRSLKRLDTRPRRSPTPPDTRHPAPAQ